MSTDVLSSVERQGYDISDLCEPNKGSSEVELRLV